jgi:hypothetical protein
MSPEQTNVVDAVGVEGGHAVVLTIIDALEWDEKNEHLLLLQNKLNAYLRFIESGEILKSYPESRDKKIIISIVALHPPNEDGSIFLQRTRQTIEGAGYGFRFQRKKQ